MKHWKSSAGETGGAGGPCDSLYQFMDGELTAELAENYRHHLAECGACAERLRDGWYLDERMERAGAGSAGSRLGASGGWRRPVLAAVTGVSAATVLAVFALPLATHTPAAPGDPPYRMAKARVGDRYLSPEQPRPTLGKATRPPVRLETLRALEEQDRSGGHLAAAAAMVEWGLIDQAGLSLAGVADPSPQRDVVASAIFLEKDPPEPEKALDHAERALRARSRYAPALWNRALALQELGLLAAASRSMDEVAELAEAGWGVDAAREAEQWRDQLDGRRKAYLAANQACRRMIEAAEPGPGEWVTQVPGAARACLYRSVRSAPTPEDVRRLLPLASSLDALDGDASLSLTRYVEGVARKDFGKRRPLAEQYRRLTLGELRPEEAQTLLQRVRQSEERDILAGLLADGPPERGVELAQIVQQSGDVWLHALAEERQAEAEYARGDLYRAVARLRRATTPCVPHKAPARAFDARCAFLKRRLALTYASLSRTAEAREHGLEALDLARLAGELGLEAKILVELGQNARQAGQTALSLAYLEETRQREPSGCASPGYFLDKPLDWEFVYSSLALTRLRALDFAGARAEIQAAKRCGPARKPTRLFAMADLARKYPPTQQEIEDFDHVLKRVWPEQKSAGRQALVRYIQGRFDMAIGLNTADELLRRVIRQADDLPDDTNARKARTYSYTALILAAGKAGELDQAFDLFAEELALPPPRSCALAVAADDEQTLVLARGPGGTIQGRYDDRRTTPLESAAGLVPPELEAELKGCASVAVLARPPLVGLPGLLPQEIAWSYLAGPARPNPGAPAHPPRSLLVTNPMPPAEQGLPRVGVFPQQALGPAPLVLQGAAATPARVREEMAQASEVYIHAHGLLEGPSEAAYIALSPDRSGSFALSAHDIRKAKLQARPLVVLIACEAAHTAPYLHEAFSLPAAFLEAGARMIFAPTVKIPDDEAAQFFGEILEGIRAGGAPAVVLRDARIRWKSLASHRWVEHVLLFQAP